VYNGIINVYKEKGFTSHDVIAKLRGILKQKKIGHTGTLDPDATGVLPVCLGNGTRLSDMLTDTDKIYRAEFVLGKVTDTQDISGTVIGGSEVTATEEEVVSVINSFVGKYSQIPPMYSAIKQEGKKLYELAREGKEVEREPREVVIHGIIIENINLPNVTITVECSKGTYIRTLCHDIGVKLGCGACMTSLVRTKVGIFTIDTSLTLAELQTLSDEDRVAEQIILPDKMFPGLKTCHTTKDGDRAVHNGNPFVAKDTLEGSSLPKDEQLLVYDSAGVFIGIFSFRSQKRMFFPDKMFYGVG